MDLSLDLSQLQVLLSHLREEKKKNKKESNEKKKPPMDFKSVERVLLFFLDATERGGLGFAFLPSYGFLRMGARYGPQYSQCPASSLGPLSVAGVSLSICTKPPPLIYQLWRSVRCTSSSLFSSPP